MAVYASGINELYNATNGDFDLWVTGVDGDFRAMLIGTDPFTQNQAHDFRNDIAADETNATGYTARGETMAAATRTKTVITSPSDAVRFDAADVVYSAIGNGTNDTCPGIVVYRDTGTDTTSALFVYVPFPSSITTNGGDLTVVFSADGITYQDTTP